MTKIPKLPQFKPATTDTAIYCFAPGASEADKQHDIEQVNKFIDSLKLKKRKK